jgi:hypothetical protein
MGRSSHLSFARAVPVALLLALAAPAAARADATLSVTGTAPHKTLTFTIGDSLDHTTAARIVSGDVMIDDSSVVVASGCAPAGGMWNCGPAADFDRLQFYLGAGNDHLDLDSASMPIAVSAGGGPGNDVLDGGMSDDELFGGPGDDDLYGAAGHDSLVAGDGDDDLYAAETPAMSDAIACGAGDDVVRDYDDADAIDNADCETTDPPVFDGPVWIMGRARVGEVLTTLLPTNSGDPGAEFFQWERCDVTGGSCSDIGGADVPTYAVSAADLGRRLRLRYAVVNALGYDAAESDATPIVDAAPPSGPWGPSRLPRPPRPHVTVPTLVIPPLVTVRKPYFALPNGDPTVDTGRIVLCPGATGGVPCGLKVTARPGGASARWRGRPASAGEASVLVAAGRPGRVKVPLNLRAYRLLRAHHKLTLSITATVTRPHSKLVRSTFTITVRTRAHKRR